MLRRMFESRCENPWNKKCDGVNEGVLKTPEWRLSRCLPEVVKTSLRCPCELFVYNLLLVFFFRVNEIYMKLDVNVSSNDEKVTAQKMKFSVKDSFSKWDQMPSFLRIWSHLLKKPLMENFIFVQWVLLQFCYEINQNTVVFFHKSYLRHL